MFDASTNISTGFSLNKTLTVHYLLIDVLLQFRLKQNPDHRRQLDVSCHRLGRIWQEPSSLRVEDFSPWPCESLLHDQAELLHLIQFPLAAKEVDDASYVDDGVSGVDSVVSSIASCRLSSRRPGSCYVNRTTMNPQCSNWCHLSEPKVEYTFVSQ